ncbi:MAG: Asp23/Gls24 family envelope stress response protein [Clostridia bacterium]|nr:Asp23/Gls24 family envelope stress response protein [Clostridia bacterium]
MKVIAFVGPSGTGKSYRSIMVSRQHGADAIIDDGLLISHGKVIAGTSAKREATKIASVKHALFMNRPQVEEIKAALLRSNVQCLMILGTSDGMVKKIARNLDVGEISDIIRIEDVATQKEMDMAVRMRRVEGKHVIPVPTFEIKQDFSGYFIHPLKRFLKNRNEESNIGAADKSIVRPTFSYLGDYTISDNVINSIAIHEANKIDGLHNVLSTNLRKTGHGIHIDMTLALKYGYNIAVVSKQVQHAVRKNVEEYTSINARRINIVVKNLVK